MSLLGDNMDAKKIRSCQNTAIIGISLGNSYFNELTVKNLVLFCEDNFPSTVILINDVPAIHNYLALGCDRKKASKKARLAGNRLRNMLNKVLIGLDIDNIKILNWDKDILSRSAFESSYSSLLSLYFKKGPFFDCVRQTTLDVLKSKFSDGVVSSQALDEAIHYLLKELAFLESSPDILGSKSASYVYHTSWPIYEKLLIGFFDDHIRRDLRFVLFP